jgi:hypothetical protein
MDIATTNANPVTLSSDSLTQTLYNLENVGTVARAIENSKEAIRINSGSYLRTVSTNISPLLRASFSIHLDLKLDDGQPPVLQFIFDIVNTSSNRLRFFVRDTGLINVTYSANGVSRFAQTTSSVFANGAMANFAGIDIVFNSAGVISIYVNNVLQTLDGAFDNDLSTLDMTVFDSLAKKLLLGYEDGGTRGINGWIRNFIIQPVVYTSQNRIDLGTL